MGHSVDTGQYRPGGTFQMGRGFDLDFERWLGGTIITVTDLLGGTGRWNKSDRHLVTPCIAPPRYPIMVMMRASTVVTTNSSFTPSRRWLMMR